MFECYTVIHLLWLKTYFWKFSKERGQVVIKKYEKKHNLFSLIYLKLISFIPSFVMNYLYNGDHQDLSNLSHRNLFKRLIILILYSYPRLIYSVQLSLWIKNHFSNVLLHYPISWLPFYEFLVNNKWF